MLDYICKYELTYAKTYVPEPPKNLHRVYSTRIVRNKFNQPDTDQHFTVSIDFSHQITERDIKTVQIGQNIHGNILKILKRQSAFNLAHERSADYIYTVFIRVQNSLFRTIKQCKTSLINTCYKILYQENVLIVLFGSPAKSDEVFL